MITASYLACHTFCAPGDWRSAKAQKEPSLHAGCRHAPEIKWLVDSVACAGGSGTHLHKSRACRSVCVL